MNPFSFELSLVAVLPALALCIYVFFKDRVEKEPIGLLALLFGVGAVAYVPCALLERLVLDLLYNAFADTMTATAEGYVTFSSTATETTYYALCAFLGFAVIRIGVQWAALYLVTFKNKNFNYLFDGVVYAVFLSLGFAVSENVHFLLQNDVELLLPKLITSVPCQLFVGIALGYYYTMWHMRFAANNIENQLLRAGAVKQDKIRSSAPWLIAGIVVPILISGLYALAGSARNETLVAVFYALVFAVFGFSFLAINHIASKDESYGKYLHRIIAKGHPELTPELINAVVNDALDTEKEGNGK